ncbi:hypothetical protein PQE75_gp022 [Bacillus phage vB_BcoS-136]|uniref:Uncharacterized protein n=1 Tax=Bacillus phage vB_BcoS-136 TaxID=2419619 RepID=A0A3G3BVB4_9CAUD|nr:hypothetical protein PQE75_gp022 [Bacillus phage vB_BcoS-136]AYP68154.1 hypothetical protein vBBcoS136_00022 [Bacillus phage vB_BcoS-136]
MLFIGGSYMKNNMVVVIILLFVLIILQLIQISYNSNIQIESNKVNSREIMEMSNMPFSNFGLFLDYKGIDYDTSSNSSRVIYRFESEGIDTEELMEDYKIWRNKSVDNR